MDDITRSVSTSRSDELFFADELETSRSRTLPSWKLLIVDDEEEVHVITRMVLEGLTFSGKGLTFLSAYSAQEAREILLEQRDIAVILLDVVMETGQAGLELVEIIRSELGNRMVRIILRTGQPGQAPEREVITRYDINDYKHKTELTAQKLFSTVTTAIRSYHDLNTIEKSRQGLDLIISSTKGLFARRNMELFAKGVLDQMSSLLQVNEDCLFLHSPSGFAATVRDGDIAVLAGTGEFEQCGSEGLGCSLDDDVTQVLQQAVGQAINPAVQGERLLARPGVLHHRGVRHVHHLLDHVEFTQRVQPMVLGQRGQQASVAITHVFDVAQPVVGQTNAGVVERRFHATAAEVAHHHEVLHLELVYRKLDGGQCVQI